MCTVTFGSLSSMSRSKRSRNVIPLILYAISLFGVFCIYDILTGHWAKSILLLPALQGTYSTASVATAMLTRNATLFRKRTDGSFPLRTYLLLWPYLSLYTLIIYFHRKVRKYEPVATQVMPGWYLSGWINNAECLRAAGSSLKKVAILDMTLDDIAKAAKWCNEMRKQDYDVVVHCAFGHGRSATCFIAALLAAGAQSGIDETESWLQGMRPHVKLTKEQYGRLTEWTKSNKCD